MYVSDIALQLDADEPTSPWLPGLLRACAQLPVIGAVLQHGSAVQHRFFGRL
jgi:hypothetical protein